MRNSRIRPNRFTHRRLTVVLSVTLIAFAGCGSNGSPGADGGETTATSAGPSDNSAVLADAALVDAAVQFVVDEEGDGVDAQCLADEFSQMTAPELQVMIDEGSSSDNPLAQLPFMAVLNCFEERTGRH